MIKCGKKNSIKILGNLKDWFFFCLQICFNQKIFAFLKFTLNEFYV